VRTLTRADVDSYFRRFFLPDNTMLAIVGDIDKSEVRRKVEAAFGKWERAARFEPPQVPQTRRQTSPIEKFVPATKEQINIIIGHLGIARKNPDYYRLLVLDTILGSSPGFTLAYREYFATSRGSPIRRSATSPRVRGSIQADS